jgi:hypothetical protein
VPALARRRWLVKTAIRRRLSNVVTLGGVPTRRRLTSVPEPDWVLLAGWDTRFARVVFSVVEDRFGLALIDTNGDGRELSTQAVVHADRAGWQATRQDDGVGQDGWQGWTPEFVYAWGRESPRSEVIVEYLGVQHTVFPTGLSWWTFLHPTDPLDDTQQTPMRIS